MKEQHCRWCGDDWSGHFEDEDVEAYWCDACGRMVQIRAVTLANETVFARIEVQEDDEGFQTQSEEE